MSGNNRTFEVDKFLTRQLFLKNPDNTTPPANLAVLTDGTGGTYLRSVYNAANPSGYNAVYLVDQQVSTVANLAYNTLKLKEGLGVAILKDRDDNIVIKSVSIIPSSFSFISTPTGIIYSERVMDTLKIMPLYGVNVSVSSNQLYIGGNASFGRINVSTINSTKSAIVASPEISSFSVVPGFGIDLQVRRPNTLVIATTSKSYALNKVTVNSAAEYNFNSTFNNLNLNSQGNLSLKQTDPNSLEITSHSFSKIVTSNGDQVSSALTGPTLKFLTGYGLETKVSDSTIQINSTKPAFDLFKTPRGSILATTTSTNVNFLSGYGIDYSIYGQNLTIKLASTFGSAIQTETVSTIATQNSVFNLRAGSSIEYSNTPDGALKIDTNDFSEIRAGCQILNSNNSDPYYKKKLRLLGLGSILVQGDPLTNTVAFLLTGGQAQSTFGNSYAFSQVLINSTVNSINEDTTKFPCPFILNSAPNHSATLGITGINPISVIPRYDFFQSSLFYIGLDKDALYRSTIANIDVSTLSVKNSVVLSKPGPGTLLTVQKISCQQAEIQNLTLSSIVSPQGNTLLSFDFLNSRVGINKNDTQPLATLDVSGTIVARAYATYSDPVLKSFTKDYTVTPEELDSLVPKHFNWLIDNTADVGFSANDVEKVLPQAVQIGPTGLKMVDYSRLSIVTIACLRDSNNRIKALESTLQAIQSKL